MSNAVAQQSPGQQLEQVLIGGDLSKLSANDRIAYYKTVCDSVGLNPLTKPFEYITLNGKMVLYARKDCTDQLRQRDSVSVTLSEPKIEDGICIVRAKASRPDGRCDESVGAVSIEGLKGEARSNAFMKAETKAKRRVTLSICGLGMLDESEIESIPTAKFTPPTPEPPTILKQLPEPGAIGEPTEDIIPCEVPERLEEMYQTLKGHDKFAKLAVFSGLKADLKRLLDDDDCKYYEILNHYGVEKSDQFKKAMTSQCAARDMYIAIQKALGSVVDAERAPYVATDEDVALGTR